MMAWGESTAEIVSYQGSMKLPFDLDTSDRTKLERGRYQLEVRLEEGLPLLVFISGGQTVALVRAQATEGDQEETTVPVVGTIFMRLTNLPMPTDEDRHYSKTGRPQYEEERRDWKATMRVYAASRESGATVVFLFHLRGKNGEWMRVSFKLSRS